MAIKLHRCGAMWMKGPHPCWKVQKALDEAGVEYEVVKHPGLPRGRRKELAELTGQKLLPALQLDDGTVVREESSAMVERIKAGELRAGDTAPA
ncbi:MAG TPA: glutathione S-transferase N-terminal domain-containing protein [Thermoleophilaceae bacterium]|jgi:glutathione S-transferase